LGSFGNHTGTKPANENIWTFSKSYSNDDLIYRIIVEDARFSLIEFESSVAHKPVSSKEPFVAVNSWCELFVMMEI
jgi:hypothetical protein